jgi:hypothetical protein
MASLTTAQGVLSRAGGGMDLRENRMRRWRLHETVRRFYIISMTNTRLGSICLLNSRPRRMGPITN